MSFYEKHSTIVDKNKNKTKKVLKIRTRMCYFKKIFEIIFDGEKLLIPVFNEKWVSEKCKTKFPRRKTFDSKDNQVWTFITTQNKANF